jgi:hypothetical protein
LPIAFKSTSHPVDLHFDERRALPSPRTPDSLTHYLIHTLRAPVRHNDAREAIATSPMGMVANRCRSPLRNAQCITVVLEQEDHRQSPESCEIARLMEGALIRGTFAEARYSNVIRSLNGGSQRMSDCYWDQLTHDDRGLKIHLRVVKMKVPALTTTKTRLSTPNLRDQMLHLDAFRER